MIKTDEDIFIQEIDNWVLDAIAQGQKSLDQILTSLPSVYPKLVLSSIQRLMLTADHHFMIPDDTKINRELPRKLGNSYHDIKLPIPHPLDYDWRFSDSSVDSLLKKCLEISFPEDIVLLLGTPSILRAAIEQAYPRKMILIDANSTIIETLKEVAQDRLILRCDVGKDKLPEACSSVVIADPPWYEDHIHLFLWAACQVCKIGGHILISLPPVGTRPGMEHEWINTLDWAQKIGLTLVQLEQTTLPYVSPLFECNALRSEGIYNISSEWRRGNLAIFRRAQQVAIQKPELPRSNQNGWTEEVLSNIRIRIKPSDEIGFQDPSLISIIPGDILPSVSRRDKRRELADVWTSGNRVFQCQGKRTLQLILRALVLNTLPDEFLAQIYRRKLSNIEAVLVSQTVNQILSVVSIERNEIWHFEKRSNVTRY